MCIYYVLVKKIGWNKKKFMMKWIILFMVHWNGFYLLCLQFPVVGQNGGLITLPRIADMYESLGRFLKDLGLLNQVCYTIHMYLQILKILWIYTNILSFVH